MGGFAVIPGMADPRNSLAATFLSLFGSVIGICCLIGFFLMMVALIGMSPMAILRLARTNSVLSAANPFALLADIFAGGLDYLVFLSLIILTYLGALFADGPIHGNSKPRGNPARSHHPGLPETVLGPTVGSIRSGST
ncbi:hypothetical protein IV102_34560 [bacterium]|nr:hypothetical protein [bacterium]